MKKTVFIKNAAILTVSSLVLRFLGIIFKVWLGGRIGSEGIGLYQLIFSVYMLAATLVTSGISTAVTRLIADELALGSERGVKKLLVRSLQLTLAVSLITVTVLYFGSDMISKYFLSDMRAAPAIRTLSFSLPFMGISSCFKGYFIARRKASPTATSQLIEQAVRIALVVFLVGRFAHKGLGTVCAAVLLGDTVSEGVSAVYLWMLYLFDKKNLSSLSGRERPPFGVINAITRIALPIASGRCLNSLLRTTESVLVPKCLSQHRLSGDRALSQFGMIKGMALPILFFPSTLLNALSTLLIPEMSEAAARGRKQAVKCAAERILKLTLLTSLIFAAVFLICGDRLGMIIYKSEDIGFLIKALAPIVPFMYLDSISDGILKGLDQQSFTFRTSVSDSLIRIALVVAVLPRSGLYGFIGIMYFSNLLTCLLNVGRLKHVSGAKGDAAKELFLPLTAALSVTFAANTLLSFLPIGNILHMIILISLVLPIYIIFLFAIGSITADDLKLR